MTYSLTGFLDHTQLRTILGRAPLISSSQRTLPENTQRSQETDIHARGGIRAHNPSRRTAADPRLISRGHWDGRILYF